RSIFLFRHSSMWLRVRHHARDDDGGAVRGVLKRVAIKEREIGILTWLDRADAFLNAQQFRCVDGDGGQRLLAGQPVSRSHGGLEKNDTCLRHITFKPALERERD